MKALKRKSSTSAASAPRSNVVYTQAPLMLGALLGRKGSEWRVRVGTVERSLRADESVDPKLLEEAITSKARVMIDASGEPTIVGVVMTSRSIGIDRSGRVRAEVESFEVTAKSAVLLRTPGAFIQAKAREIEVYGDRVLTRARDMAKILAAMIKLN